VRVVILCGFIVDVGGKMRFNRKSIEFSSSGFHFNLLSETLNRRKIHMTIRSAYILPVK
jgi:hypothetical protein